MSSLNEILSDHPKRLNNLPYSPKRCHKYGGPNTYREVLWIYDAFSANMNASVMSGSSFGSKGIGLQSLPEMKWKSLGERGASRPASLSASIKRQSHTAKTNKGGEIPPTIEKPSLDSFSLNSPSADVTTAKLFNRPKTPAKLKPKFHTFQANVSDESRMRVPLQSLRIAKKSLAVRKCESVYDDCKTQDKKRFFQSDFSVLRKYEKKIIDGEQFFPFPDPLEYYYRQFKNDALGFSNKCHVDDDFNLLVLEMERLEALTVRLEKREERKRSAAANQARNASNSSGSDDEVAPAIGVEKDNLADFRDPPQIGIQIKINARKSSAGMKESKVNVILDQEDFDFPIIAGYPYGRPQIPETTDPLAVKKIRRGRRKKSSK